MQVLWWLPLWSAGSLTTYGASCSAMSPPATGQSEWQRGDTSPCARTGWGLRLGLGMPGHPQVWRWRWGSGDKGVLQPRGSISKPNCCFGCFFFWMSQCLPGKLRVFVFPKSLRKHYFEPKGIISPFSSSWGLQPQTSVWQPLMKWHLDGEVGTSEWISEILIPSPKMQQLLSAHNLAPQGHISSLTGGMTQVGE